MIICIDYDDTFSADPAVWSDIIRLMTSRGWEVWCATSRSPEAMPEVHQAIGPLIGARRCIPTSGAPKRQALQDDHGLSIDIWIDDMPETIGGRWHVSAGGLLSPHAITEEIKR